MDPWSSNNPLPSDGRQSLNDKFEDNFKPTVGETLPDSKQYLETLENKLQKLKNDPDVLRQLAEKREACMQSLLRGESDYNYNQNQAEDLDCPVNSSAILRAVAPERQALTTGEVVELVKYDLLSEEDQDHSDSASR